MSESGLTEAYVQQLISGFKDLAISRRVTIAGYGILIYDHILTVGTEIDLIWLKPKSLVSYAFLFNRYGVPLFVALDIWQIIGTAQNVPSRFCHDWLFVEGVLQIICHGIAHCLAALRVRALHSGRPWVDYLLYVTGTLYAAITIAVLFLVLVDVSKTYAWNTTLSMCFGEFPSWMYWCWIPGLVFEAILFGLIILKAARDWKRDIAFPITRLLYRDGLIYFIVITACSIFNIIAWTALPSTMVALAKYFSFSLVAVMSSRIVLNLRMLRQRPSESQGATTDNAFELGALSLARNSRKSVYCEKGHYPTRAPSSSWTGNRLIRENREFGQSQTTSVPVAIQVDVLREVDVSEIDGEESDSQGWSGYKKSEIDF